VQRFWEFFARCLSSISFVDESKIENRKSKIEWRRRWDYPKLRFGSGVRASLLTHARDAAGSGK
jgi:hypothetical protein